MELEIDESRVHGEGRIWGWCSHFRHTARREVDRARTRVCVRISTGSRDEANFDFNLREFPGLERNVI